MQRTWIDIFLKKTYRWPTGTWKDALPSLIIRGIQIKAIVSYHLTPIRMAIIKKIRNNKCWWGCQEKGMNPLYTVVGNVDWYSQCGKQYGVSSKKKKKKKNYFMIQQFLFWIFIWRKQKHKFEKIHAPHDHCSIVYHSQGMETT